LALIRAGKLITAKKTNTTVKTERNEERYLLNGLQFPTLRSGVFLTGARNVGDGEVMVK
jgi:hypothetical protein